MAKRAPVILTKAETTGHEWDGITELNKPLPKWWLWTTAERGAKIFARQVIARLDFLDFAL